MPEDKTKEDLEWELFVLEMKDHWDNSDFDEANRLRKLIKEMEK